ncbi:hypothetical protein GCM10023259_028220 [Thermocatellispora tengchongensis]
MIAGSAVFTRPYPSAVPSMIMTMVTVDKTSLGVHPPASAAVFVVLIAVPFRTTWRWRGSGAGRSPGVAWTTAVPRVFVSA